MSFVLSKRRAKRALLSLSNKFQSTEVFEDGHTAASKDFNSLLGIGFVTVRQVADGCLGTVRKTQRAEHIVVAVFAWVQQAARFNFHRWRGRQKTEEVHKVANLAQNTPSALKRVV